MGLFRRKNKKRRGNGWFKRSLKKVGRVSGDIGKFALNTATSPVRQTINVFNGKKGAPQIGRYNTKAGKGLQKASNIIGGVALGAGVAKGALALGAGKVAVGGVKGIKKIFGRSGGKSIKKLLSPKKKSMSKFSSSVAPTKESKTSLANLLNGNKESGTMLNSFLSKDSGIGGIFAKLPKIGDILDGASKGAGEVLTDSEAGQEVKQKAVKSWFDENLPKLAIGILAVLVSVFGFLAFRPKKTNKYKKRR